jgi:eukaryotic-like serine/threonine-protein kinase
VILDFDLAWWRSSPPRNDGAFRGTVTYVAPEVARGEMPTQRSDLFSLGAILLHLATGVAPRTVTSSLGAALLIAGESPLSVPNAAQLRARGPSHAAIVDLLIAHDPADRPSSAEELLKSLAP